jgi:hypothetical protein
MTPTIGAALAKAAELEKQGCITHTALSLIVLAQAFKDVVGEDVFLQYLNEKDSNHE